MSQSKNLKQKITEKKINLTSFEAKKLCDSSCDFKNSNKKMKYSQHKKENEKICGFTMENKENINLKQLPNNNNNCNSKIITLKINHNNDNCIKKNNENNNEKNQKNEEKMEIVNEKKHENDEKKNENV